MGLDYFVLFLSGCIMIIKILDFEFVNIYILSIFVFDGKIFVIEVIIILVCDINDLLVFVNLFYVVILFENNVSVVVSVMSVIDDDSGDILIFFLLGVGSGDFFILLFIGLVFFSRVLDYESKFSYVLNVIVCDEYGG